MVYYIQSPAQSISKQAGIGRGGGFVVVVCVNNIDSIVVWYSGMVYQYRFSLSGVD